MRLPLPLSPSSRIPSPLLSFLPVLLSLFAVACQDVSEPDTQRHEPVPIDPASLLGPMANLNEQNPGERGMARTADLDVKVAGFDEARKNVETLLADLGGTLYHLTREREDSGLFRGTLVLRVPSEHFREAMDKLAALGEVFSQNESGEDVSSQAEDVTLRLKNAQALEGRILQLMAEREARLPDLLEAERELARVRERIESLDARLRKLNDRTAFSTITLNLFVTGSKAALVKTWWAPFYYQALRVGNTFATSLGWLLAVVVFLLPWISLLWFSPSLVGKLRRRFRDMREDSDLPLAARRNTRRNVGNDPLQPGTAPENQADGEDGP